MEGIVSFGNRRSYEDFKSQIPSPARPLFDSLRNFCMSLGENVVEDVRMHRIVFGKSMALRWFADLEPATDQIIIKIQKSRKEAPKTINVKLDAKLDQIQDSLKDAYQCIH